MDFDNDPAPAMEPHNHPLPEALEFAALVDQKHAQWYQDIWNATVHQDKREFVRLGVDLLSNDDIEVVFGVMGALISAGSGERFDLGTSAS